MTTEEKAKAYNRALEQAKQELEACGSIDCDAARQIFRLFPELKEKPLTPFQVYLNLILRKVYFAEVPDEKVTDYIIDIVKKHTKALIELTECK